MIIHISHGWNNHKQRANLPAHSAFMYNGRKYQNHLTHFQTSASGEVHTHSYFSIQNNAGRKITKKNTDQIFRRCT